MLVIAMTSCNALKRVGDNELLLTKNTIYTDSVKVNNEDVHSLIFQKPNSTVLGYPLRLNLYNLAKKDPDSSYKAWLHKKEKREQRLINLLSKKQVERLGESFLVKGYSVWLKNIGEAPVVIDTSRARRSLQRLSAYYKSKGYFNNNTSFVLDSSRRKQRAAIDYNITLGEPYKIDSLQRSISSPQLDSIHLLNVTDSYLKSGNQINLEDLSNERERLTELFRNTGVYNFQESSISFDLVGDTTKIGTNQKLDILLNIEDLNKRTDNALTSSEYKVHTFKKINIYTDYSFNGLTDSLQSIDYNDFTIYYKDRLRYKPKALTDAIFIKKDSIYKEIDRIRTHRQISNLNTFKYPNIEFVEDSTEAKLTANIHLSPRPRYSLGIDFDVTHSNIQFLGLGFSPSLQARNLFKGAENLSISGRINMGASKDPSIVDNRFFNILEFGGDINLNIPRIWMPLFNTTKLIPNYMVPQTKISLGTSFQQNIGLDKETFNAILGYNWSPTDHKKNTIELLNVQFVRNVNPDRFFSVYQNTFNKLDRIANSYQNNPSLSEFYETPEGSTEPRLIIPEGASGFTKAILNKEVNAPLIHFNEVSSIEERRKRLSENNLIFASNYTYNKNNKISLTDNDFYQFRFKLESAGNLLSGISNLISFDKSENNKKLVFGVPYSQYIKTEFDYIQHWSISSDEVLAFRSFFGIAIPYGNSDNIPFARSYFAGGSNDNRAWLPYSLGPGRTQDVNDFNEANLKIALNLEYRFPIAGNIKGALFADAGNIWNVLDNVQDEAATFNNFDSLADIALGTGLGIRYDFSYFVFRLDMGFKTYNPAEENSKRWFRDYNLANGVFNIGINYPF
ncbi:translocation and assembly module lipoprotein TamL [Arenibacter latericius]|uniref:translocation and assembly module lipoprotein TamL n=1 Tax=Arenibacter latericius TaxID=86104 RepID=UPI00293417AF|nr:BamA/TamA family outer membrane protein [Arenibacter latericius]MDX1363832.1 BamA/TamA family outer membrane protein [Arenibacter latericius]